MGEQQQEIVGRREGNRWINEKPEGEDVAKWFKDAVILHDGMDASRYVGGIVLIAQKEKVKEARLAQDQSVRVVDVDQLAFTPYAKVETRIAYFWDYVRMLNEENAKIVRDGEAAGRTLLADEYVGRIEPAEVKKLRAENLTNEHLPEGFFRMPVMDTAGKLHQFLGCSMKATIIRRNMRSGEGGIVVMESPPGTKIVPLVGSYGPDENAIMKAETGAVGRALGMAGMLVIPGSGVASAEDMVDLATSPGTVPVAADLPEETAGAAGPPDLRTQAAELRQEIESDFPALADELESWAKEREISLNDLKDDQLRPVVRQMQRKLDEARAARAA